MAAMLEGKTLKDESQIVIKLEETSRSSIALSKLTASVFAPGTFSFVALYFCDVPEDYGKAYFTEFEPAA